MRSGHAQKKRAIGAIRAPRGALTVGALFGYSSVNSTESLKVPSSHAVSSGLVRVCVRVSVSVPPHKRCGQECPPRGRSARPRAPGASSLGASMGLVWLGGAQVWAGTHPKMTACHFMMSLS